MHGAKLGTFFKAGQARYGNAVYTYRPDFTKEDYREAVVEEDKGQVTFGFRTPYVIGATPTDRSAWGIYQPGCRNGLVLHGQATCPVSLSVDDGGTWLEAGRFKDGLDLTDLVKGRQSYQLRLQAPASILASAGLLFTTVCQLNPAMLPRLKDGGTRVQFAASGLGVVSAGPTMPLAQTHVVSGAFDSTTVTLAQRTPHGETVKAIYAAAHMASGNPPRPEVKSQIDFSTDNGVTWQSLTRDWQIPRRGKEPGDFWSQSFCYGSTNLAGANSGALHVRFRNNSGKRYLRAEAHLVHATGGRDGTKVTYSWTDSTGTHVEAHQSEVDTATWALPTATNVQTRWVEFEPVPTR